MFKTTKSLDADNLSNTWFILFCHYSLKLLPISQASESYGVGLQGTHYVHVQGLHAIQSFSYILFNLTTTRIITSSKYLLCLVFVWCVFRKVPLKDLEINVAKIICVRTDIFFVEHWLFENVDTAIFKKNETQHSAVNYLSIFLKNWIREKFSSYKK